MYEEQRTQPASDVLMASGKLARNSKDQMNEEHVSACSLDVTQGMACHKGVKYETWSCKVYGMSRCSCHLNFMRPIHFTSQGDFWSALL